ncbi:hypothetical protein GCM10023092_03870 [Rurimicrobium arvi]|uniref:Transglutaminase-like domain-containing protein n=2 Tax=Rurimicrobium arvi TaxID=2049916 RepID=A0ABP8MI40_9BACT
MNFLPANTIDPFPYVKSGDDRFGRVLHTWYRPELNGRFTDMNSLLAYARQQKCRDTLCHLEAAAWVLRHRFVHAYGVYNVRENWIAVLCGRFIWKDLAAKVLPDDILSGESASCSQVSIIFIALCRSMGVPARKVALRGHFAMEAKLHGQWFFFDIDMKPDFSTIGGRRSLASILAAGAQYRLYAHTASRRDVDRIFSSVIYGADGEWLAPRAAVFQTITRLLSHWGWLLPALGWALLSARVWTLKRRYERMWLKGKHVRAYTATCNDERMRRAG